MLKQFFTKLRKYNKTILPEFKKYKKINLKSGYMT